MRRSRDSRWRTVPALAVGATVLALVTAAHANSSPGNPGTPAAPAVPAAPPLPDTQYTPLAKDGCAGGWSQVAGAVFPGAAPCHGYDAAVSPVPFTVDFFTVSFLNQKNGFAAGAECADPSTKLADVDGCVRVPVIYQYTDTPQDGPRWTKVALPGAQTPGYVGAIEFV
jgi:hypothetical protein